LKHSVNFQAIDRVAGIFLLTASIWVLLLIAHSFFYPFIFISSVGAVVLYRWSKTPYVIYLLTGKTNPELKATGASILRGKRIAEVARSLSKATISYQNIHYQSIDQTLASLVIDCSSFVRRVIYIATRVDIGNLMSNDFATSSYFIAFYQQSQALPGDIVHVRGHVAICLDEGCRTVAEATSDENGVVVQSISKSPVAHIWSPITYYRLRLE
jgi:hypothetical protein